MAKNARPLDPAPVTGGGGGVDESAAKAAPKAGGFEPAPTTAPNCPSFDYNPKTMLPNLRDGETVIADVQYFGIPIFVTSSSRKIYCCPIPTYESKFGPLPEPRSAYLSGFPWAVQG